VGNGVCLKLLSGIVMDRSILLLIHRREYNNVDRMGEANGDHQDAAKMIAPVQRQSYISR
jgi:hypothetical protein